MSRLECIFSIIPRLFNIQKWSDSMNVHLSSFLKLNCDIILRMTLNPGLKTSQFALNMTIVKLVSNWSLQGLKTVFNLVSNLSQISATKHRVAISLCSSPNCYRNAKLVWLRLRSCLFCEGRISVLKRWFKTPIQNAVNSGYCSSSSEPERRLYDVI